MNALTKNISIHVACLAVGTAAGFGLSSIAFPEWKRTAGMDSAESTVGISIPDEKKSRPANTIPNAGPDYLRKRAQWLAIASGDIAAVRRVLQSCRDYHEIERLLIQWAKLDPSAAFQFTASLGSHWDAVLTVWAESEPEAALLAFAQLHTRQGELFDNRALSQAADAALARIWASDPERALELLAQPGLSHLSLNLDFSLHGLAKNPDRAFALIDRLPRAAQSDAMADYGIAWVREDPEAAATWASDLTNYRARNRSLIDVFDNWKDLDAVGNFLERVPPGQDKSEVVRRYVERLVNEDTDRAFAWVDENLTGASRVDAFETLFENAARSDLEATARHVAALDPGGIRDRSIQSISRMWFDRDLDSARGWLESLPDDGARNRAFGELAEAWLEKDAEAAAQYAIDHPEIPENFLWQVAWHLPDTDPAKALDWAFKLPAERQLDMASLAIGQWAKHHPEAAGAFVSELPAGDYRERAIAAVHRQWVRRDQSSADSWRQKLGR